MSSNQENVEYLEVKSNVVLSQPGLQDGYSKEAAENDCYRSLFALCAPCCCCLPCFADRRF